MNPSRIIVRYTVTNLYFQTILTKMTKYEKPPILIKNNSKFNSRWFLQITQNGHFDLKIGHFGANQVANEIRVKSRHVFLPSQSKLFLIWLLIRCWFYPIVNPTNIKKFFLRSFFDISANWNFSGNFLFKFSWNKSLFAFLKFPDV